MILGYAIFFFLIKKDSQNPLIRILSRIIVTLVLYAFVKVLLTVASLRWQDLSLFFFIEQQVQHKHLALLWEMLLPISLFFFISFIKKSNFAWVCFLGFSGYNFFVMFVIINMPFYDWHIDNSASSNAISNGQVSSKQVIWIVFDEFDPEIAFDTEPTLKLPTFEKIKNEGVYNRLNYPPGDSTIYSVPAMLMGIPINGYKITGNQKLELTGLAGQTIKFGYQGSVFDKVKQLGHDSSIYGVYHPYCMVFNQVDCKEIQPFDSKWHSAITRFPLRILNVFYPKFNPLTASESGDLLAMQLDGLYDFLGSKKQDFLFVHLLLPHLPATASKKYYQEFTLDYSGDEAYKLNLKFSDHVLENILDSIPKDGRQRLLILTSDHWLRTKDRKHSHPSLWIGKVLGDKNGFEGLLPTNSIYTPILVVDYLNGKINSNRDIKQFFVGKSNPGTYIATGSQAIYE